MTTCSTIKNVWKGRLEALRAKHLERQMRIFSGPSAPEMPTPDGPKLNFCSNDYLGLANDADINGFVGAAFRDWGTGAGASRLVSGNYTPHEALEGRLAEYLNAEAAALFVSGYQANVGTLSALTARGDAIFSDQLAHASLIDGARLSKADVHVFRHGDMSHLEALLRNVTVSGLKLIVTDAVFSMDGDTADLPTITSLAESHNALVYIDEAHALGVLGPGGRGLSEAHGLSHRIAVRLGTFSKAFGSFGAFVAGGEDAISLLKSTARSLLYSTAPPAALSEIQMKSLSRVEAASDLRATLRHNIRYFRQAATDRGLPLLHSETPIQPIITTTEIRTLAASDALWRRGVFVQGIRPPTVPEGMSRLRVTLSAKHTEAHISRLADALAETLAETPR